MALTRRKCAWVLAGIAGIVLIKNLFNAIVYTSHKASPRVSDSLQQRNGERLPSALENRNKDPYMYVPERRANGNAQYNKPRVYTKKVKYVYHTQVAECLSADYLRREIFGAPEECQCFVVVLSFSKTCEDASRDYPHLRYIDNFNISLNAGRNLMYELGRTLIDTSAVLYYIFMDGDIVIERTDDAMLAKSVVVDKSVPVLRSFEKFLSDVQPVVGSGLYSPMGLKYEFLGNFLGDCCGTTNYTEANLPEHYPMTVFDDSFLAYHRGAMKHLFPLPLAYESESWWMTVVIMRFRVYARYRGQALRYTPLQIINTGHVSYPQVPGGVVGYAKIQADERVLAPKRLQDHEIWRDPLFINRTMPPSYSLKNPQFRYVPFSENPNMEPYYGL